MAEAHAAVAFQFTVTQEGLNVQISHEAIRAVYHSGVRSWRKRTVRFLNRFRSGVYPAKFSSLGIFTLLSILASVVGFDLTYGLTDKIQSLLFSVNSNFSWFLSQSVASLLVWLAVVLIIRYLLKFLLCYHGWMFEPRGKVSIVTSIWAGFTKVLCGSNPQLYSYQSSLPRLPVPKLSDTVSRYMRSVRPLLNDDEFNAMQKLSEDFLGSVASRLQRYLVFKSWWSSNYVTDWWEQYVYLAGRGPIMVNSNYYGMDLLYHVPTNRQASRAGSFVHAMLAFRSTLDKEKVNPIRVNGVIPLCSAQYERVFNTSRIPGIECDKIHHWQDCRHVAVLHKGRWFKLMCYKQGKLLEPCELEIAFEKILDDTSPPSGGEEHLAALTAGERTLWAKARSDFFAIGANRKSLHAIEKSAFVVVLDDTKLNIENASVSGLTSYGRSLLHGKCFDRWFDKSFNCVVYADGRVGVNAEHSWADAPIMSHLMEESLGYEFKNISYGEDGKVEGVPTMQPVPPERLKWDLTKQCQEVIERSLSVAQNLADDVHLHVSPFQHFGKGLIKTFKVSPDAFIQMALQLAHLRDKGHFSLTYEASMTRLFREGRTETVRSCTNEMVAFARSMDDESKTDEDRHGLLKVAAERHVTSYKEAMAGMGVDRHLFCLYVVSKYLKVESPFLQKVLCEPWRLSTSQTPHQQVMAVDLKKHPTFLSGGGGFGPVADDGYGVSYIICHEDLIMFHISSKHSSPETDSSRFAANIERAMLDMKKLCEKAKKK